MLCALPPTARGIVTDLHISFRKKARGTLVATCRCDPPRGDVDEDITVQSELTDADGDVVAVTRVAWKIGPRPA